MLPVRALFSVPKHTPATVNGGYCILFPSQIKNIRYNFRVSGESKKANPKINLNMNLLEMLLT